jgi:hypothetical protein
MAGASGRSPDGAAVSPSPAASSDDASNDSVSVVHGATAADAGTLFIEAVGGPAGEVAAEVGLFESGVGSEKTCTRPLNSGACQLTSCEDGPIGDPAPGYGNIGPVSASIGTTTVLLTYDLEGYPTVAFPSSIALGEGGIMEFRGGNRGGVPAFDVTATIPGLAVMTSPALTTDGGSAIIDTSHDLSVTWAPISIGQVHFQLQGVILPASPPSIGEIVISLDCTFEGAAGAGVVPRGLLSSLKAMSGTNPTYAGLGSEVNVTTVVGGLTIVTRSSQRSPATERDIDVTLE